MTKRIGGAFGLLIMCTLSPVWAGGVGDVTLRTDHPHYPGEGAFQTIEDCVQFATAGKKSEQEKAIAL